MSAAIRDYLPLVLSMITIWMTLLAGNKHPSAWAEYPDRFVLLFTDMVFPKNGGRNG